MSTPPLPAGYALDQQPQQPEAAPPLPPGYQLDATPSAAPAGLKIGSIPKPNAQDVADRLTKQYVPAIQMAMGGGGIEKVGAEGIAAAAKMIPSAERAGQAFREVSAAVGSHTVPITEELSNALMKYQSLVDNGGSRSMAVSKLLNRITNPEALSLTYNDARQFYSNISRLSADEMQRLTPVMRRAVGEVASTFNDAISKVPAAAGKLEQFQGAMKEYAAAKDLSAKAEIVKKFLIKQGLKAAGTGAAGAAGYGLYKELGQ